MINAIGQQSADIAMGVDESMDHEQGAGDQGLMFGYATNETDVLMPAPISYSHRLVQKQAELRKSGKLAWLRPDAKSQVTFKYGPDGKPVAVDAIVLSTQHDPSISQADLQEAVREEIIKAVIPANWMSADTKVYINPTGQFIIGGPVGDCGLTGRKIIVDTYGGMARHGGGAFSGKDPSKVDRSAAYAGRYVAKNIVAAGPRGSLRDPGLLRHRRRRADLHLDRHLRHGHAARRQDRRARARALRSAPEGPHLHARPEASDLPRHGGLRALRP